jgi:hypothetical protein
MIDPTTKSERTRNYLKAALFDGPDWIPCNVGIMPATWHRHRRALEDVLAEFPKLFPGFRKGRRDFDSPGDGRYREGRTTDNWGCVWNNIAAGLAGGLVGSPIEEWGDLQDYEPPDPITEGEGRNGPPDWEVVRDRCRRAVAEGRLGWGHMPHGSMYMRLYYLRGFENFMIDVATDDPHLPELIEMVLDYNLEAIEKNLECGVEIMGFGDDLGFQRSLAISPAKWRRYLGPCYRRMFGLCRDREVLVRLHTDGHVLPIIPDLIESGVTILNPQVRANGLEGLARVARGKVCLHLDLDRQLFPVATPGQLAEHVREAVRRLAMPEGGLMLYAECEPDVPLENIRAICRALEEVGGPGQ